MSTLLKTLLRCTMASGCLLSLIGATSFCEAQPMTAASADNLVIASVTLVNAPKKLAPGAELIFKLDGGLATDPQNYRVRIEGVDMSLKGPPVWCAKDQQLQLTLAEDTVDKPQWRSVYRNLFTRQHNVTIDLEAKTGDSVLQHLQVGNVPLGFSGWRLALGIGLSLLVLIGAITFGKFSTLLRDPMLPQLQQQDQPYSLARCQMMLWTVLILVSYVLLYALTGNYETITSQLLLLMGISGTTGLAAYGVDVIKDTPIDRANTYLRSLGINTYDDVIKAQEELANLAPANDAVSNARKRDLDLLLRTYDKRTAPFKSQYFLSDLITDINGSALHRVQLVIWTLILGFVFVHEVLTTLAMPTFSTTLLGLLGISGSGYVLMKYPEVQH